MFQADINFTGIVISRAGIYCYTICEKKPCCSCWRTDCRTYKVKITVIENENGVLEAKVEYPCGIPVFKNRFCGCMKCLCCCCKCG